MYLVAQKDLPFHGMSHEFVGGSPTGRDLVYLVESPPGRSTRRHRHPYDEVAFVREGRAVGPSTASNETRCCRAPVTTEL